MGVSSATGPTPNKGYEAAAQQRLGMVIKILGELIPLAGATSDIGNAAMDAIKKLSKFAPPGSTSPAGERNQIESMMLKNTQNQQMQQQMRPMAQGGQPGAAQQMPPRAA